MEKNRAEMDIIQELKRNNQQALGYLFDEYYSRLCLFANSLINNQLEAEDQVRPAFIKVWNKRMDFASEKEIKAYLYKVTRNACLKFIKRRKYKIINIDSIKDPSDQISQSDIDLQILTSENIALLMQKVEELPTECRNVFLDLYNRFTIQEIAEKYNITQSTVRNQKARAIKLLKIKLSDKPLLLAILFLLLEIYEN
jgi:RNA polymerase sigma-70 factor (family 1)